MKLPDELWDVQAPAPDAPPSDAADDTAAWAKTSGAKRPGAPPKTSRVSIARAVDESAMMRTTRDWSGAKPSHLVALYAWCHERTYGVAAEVLADGKAFAQATLACARMLKEDFGGDVVLMVGGYVQWSWRRERGREEWRRANAQPGGRIGWRLQFTPGGGLVTDWRVARARATE